MFFFAKSAKEDSSTSSSSTGKPPPLRRHDTFGSVELFEAWAKDSFISQSTVDILANTHEINCLPAVLALKKEDFPHLNLPVGQRRLLEEAVEKLRQEYELVRPPTPRAKINLEMPKYKSMLETGELAEETSGNESAISETQHEVPSRGQSEYTSQRKSGQRKSKVELGKDEKDSRPEKEALLVADPSKTASQMPSRAGQRKKGDKRSSRISQEHSNTKNYRDEDDTDDEENMACACQRWFFVFICMPVFMVLSIVGLILIVLIIPFRLCCPKGGVYSNALTFLFEVFLMAPCVACKWASGKRKSQGNSASGKPRYGGTDDVELGSK